MINKTIAKDEKDKSDAQCYKCRYLELEQVNYS